MTPTEFLNISVEIGFFLVMGSILLGFVRLAKGPSLADRVVALDMMTVSIVAFCALFAIRTNVTAFLDVAIVLALIGFLATLALARYAERRMYRDSKINAPTTVMLHEAAEHDSDTSISSEDQS